MATTPLTNIVSQSAREKLYAAYAVIGVIIGATQVAYATVPELGQPKALLVVIAVYGYLGIAFGATAASNANNPTPPQDAPVPGDEPLF